MTLVQKNNCSAERKTLIKHRYGQKKQPSLDAQKSRGVYKKGWRPCKFFNVATGNWVRKLVSF
jgi:hypothetical protein